MSDLLVGLALLHDHTKTGKPKTDEDDSQKGKEDDIQTKIEHLTRALAPGDLTHD